MMKGILLKLSIVGYTLLVLFYNLSDNATPTKYYYVFEKLFILMMLFIEYKNSSLTDKLFINYARILTILTISQLLLSSFQDGANSYVFVLTTSSVILSIFGSLIALYLEIRRDKL